MTKKTIVKKGGTKVSTTEERDEFDDLMDEELGMVTKTTNVVIKEKKKAGGKAATDDGPKEIAAGTLPASKNTEMGFKQRKVNKRFKSYETEEKDDDEFDGGKC